jgi:exonuclease SbcC
MRLRTEERNAENRVTSVQQQLQAIDAKRKRKQQLEERHSLRSEEYSLHDQLKEAFGKNGVPAMIIETAIPELEAIANELLFRMTAGRMTLKLSTQREKVTGGTSETLQIDIMDELGQRNYEMFSGGEAFRINFALRIALSKLLARRAGAHLQTLFIDEGFGTQDNEGRDRLIEAINAIKDDFDMILVITHIEELKDAFPVHIHIQKTAQGSIVEIL